MFVPRETRPISPREIVDWVQDEFQELAADSAALHSSEWEDLSLIPASGWVNIGAPYANAGYCIEEEWVTLRGAVTAGTPGVALATLPALYVPVFTHLFAVAASAGAHSHVSVDTAGNIIPVVSGGASLWLDGIRFRIR